MSEYMKGYNEGYNACLKKISQMLSSANQTIHKDIKCSKCKEIMIIDIMEDGCEVTCNSCNKTFYYTICVSNDYHQILLEGVD